MKPCDKCGQDFEPNSNSQKHCKDCAYMLQYWKSKTKDKLKQEKKVSECKAVRNKDGTIDFEKEAKEFKHLLKFYGLRP